MFSISYFWAKLKVDDLTGQTDSPEQVKQRAGELRYDAPSLSYVKAPLQDVAVTDICAKHLSP